jgi:hypothetical protein
MRATFSAHALHLNIVTEILVGEKYVQDYEAPPYAIFSGLQLLPLSLLFKYSLQHPFLTVSSCVFP